MKKYEQLEMKVILFNEDIVRTSTPDGENNLPWVDMRFN